MPPDTTIPLPEPDWILEVRQWLQDRDNAHAAAQSAADNAALLGEVLALQKAIALAYGHLWRINDEPGTPSPIYPAMQAAYEARKILRDPLTTEQRGNGIDAARAALGEP